MFTTESFTQTFGQAPEEDDLERVNCDILDQAGHMFCGVCPEHNQPRFLCGCPTPFKIIPLGCILKE
jgi:hypothetical protein